MALGTCKADFVAPVPVWGVAPGMKLAWLLEQTVPQALLLATLLFAHSELRISLYFPRTRLGGQVSAPPAYGLFTAQRLHIGGITYADSPGACSWLIMNVWFSKFSPRTLFPVPLLDQFQFSSLASTPCKLPLGSTVTK